MTQRSLLLSTLAATAVANTPLHLQNNSETTPNPSRRRRRTRLLTSEAQATATTDDAVSNDYSLVLELSPLLPQTSSEEVEFSSRIINGNAAPTSRYPYAASLIDDTRHVCGGTLIAPDIILTAGHCSGFFTAVQIDKYDLTQDDAYDYLLVEEHVIHPNYANIIQNDFALAKLYGRSDKPLVTLNTDASSPVDDEYLTVMGWGVTVEGVSSTQSEILREVDVQYMSNTECLASSGSYDGQLVTYDGYIEDNMLCAWSENKDACQGDSGGPLIYRGDDSTSDVQVGVVSWGLGCAMDTFPGVYSRISAEYEWIRSMVCQLSKYPPSSFGCITTSEAVGLGEKEEVTLVIELDGWGADTSWILEANDRGNFIDGTSYVPFGTYDEDNEVAVESLQVVSNQSYRWTVMDRSGASSSRSSAIFRMCYGSVSADECLNDTEAIICGGNGILSSTRSVTCDVEARTPSPTPVQVGLPVPVPVVGGRLPTFAPFFVPLFFETRQPLNRENETPAPSPSLNSITPTSSLPPASATKLPTIIPKKNSVEANDARDSNIVANAESATSSASASYVSLRQALLVGMAVAIFCV